VEAEVQLVPEFGAGMAKAEPIRPIEMRVGAVQCIFLILADSRSFENTSRCLWRFDLKGCEWDDICTIARGMKELAASLYY
jgi:hypothetical protein